MKTDSKIQQDVREELTWDARVTAKDIRVSVSNGIVTISGQVPHYIEKIAAENAAQRVIGVRAVANEINVTFFDSSTERSDQEICEAASNSLGWNYEVPAGIDVSVSNGCVTLKGHVEMAFEKIAAEKAVRSLMGVKDVHNEIDIKSDTKLADIKGRIESALRRSAEREGRGIMVKSTGDRVTLTGRVHSMADKNEAQWAAWCAPGVSHVENNLSVIA